MRRVAPAPTLAVVGVAALLAGIWTSPELSVSGKLVPTGLVVIGVAVVLAVLRETEAS